MPPGERPCLPINFPARPKIDWFAQQPTLRAAITKAAMAVNSRGTCPELRALRPHEIEDVLCIFKGKFAAPRRTSVPADATRRSWCG